MKNIRSLLVCLFTVVCLTGFIQAAAKNVEDKIKDSIENAADFLKEEVDRLGDNLAAIQTYLENYHWKGIVQDKATSGVATLSNLKLNGRGRVIAVHRGQEIKGEVDCFIDPKAASYLSVYHVVLGIKGEGPQTAINSVLGIVAGAKHEKFTLIAPSNPGYYQIRFRTADKYFESRALDAWLDENGNEPDGTTTIGIIYVRE